MFRGVKIDLEEYSRKCEIPRNLNFEEFELDLDFEEFLES